MSAPPVSRFLQTHCVSHRVYRHAGMIHSLEQAARERGQRTEQIIRSIVFRTASNSYLMVLVAGAAQVSWPALRRYLGQSRLTMANEVEVLEATGYPTGGVSPLDLPHPMRILIDRSVLAETEISIGSGERGVTILFQRADLLKLLPGAEIGDFTHPPSQSK